MYSHSGLAAVTDKVKVDESILPESQKEKARENLSSEFSQKPAEKTKAQDLPPGQNAQTQAGSDGAAVPPKNLSTPELAPPPKIEDNPSGATAPQSAAERRAAEKVYFEYLYNKKNVQLDGFQPGEGPEQVLIRMNDAGKLGTAPWDITKIHENALRISRRDLVHGKSYYSENEQTQLWSPEEIRARVEKTLNRVRGIDVSRYENDINWQAVKNSGIEFAFMRATLSKRDGSTIVDPKFEQNRAGATENGVAIGYYHFFRPDVAVKTQVDLLSKTIGKTDNQLPVVMDVEEDEVKAMWKNAPDGHEYTPKERVQIIHEFCNGIKKTLGNDTRIALYVSPKFTREFLNNDPSLAKYELWNANWKVPEPTTPLPWKKTNFWQYAGDTGKVAGITKDGGVDLDMAMDSSFIRKKKK